jgi:DNA integrity scanning protein DisA with diadenylate cyclase activity
MKSDTQLDGQEVHSISYDQFSKQLDKICCEERKIPPKILRKVVDLSIEIAREGREGRKIGTMFVVGDETNVLEWSRPLILDPLKGHQSEEKMIKDPDLCETIKELAQLDGAFVISGEGIVLSATRFIEAHSKDIDLKLGLGTRHVAAASITKETDAVAVVISESSVVRIFDDGKIVAEIIPEIWMIQRISSGLIQDNKRRE